MAPKTRPNAAEATITLAKSSNENGKNGNGNAYNHLSN
jgi:hypothetical protein